MEKLVSMLPRSEGGIAISIFIFCLALGSLLGGVIPPDESYPEPWRYISSVIGWIYFTAWSVSFWPQCIQNFQKKSVRGLSFEFVFLNLLGFACYTAFNCALYWNEDIRELYRQANEGKNPVVQANDVFFAIHAVILTVVCIIQIFLYKRPEHKTHWLSKTMICVMVGAICIYAAIIGSGRHGKWLDWLSFLNFLSYIKLSISLCKYIPQVYIIWKLKSSEGFSIYNVLLDWTGGCLSVGQQIGDCAVGDNWSGIKGDPVKFGLGFVSMFFDIIFMIQHYGFYRRKNGYQTFPDFERETSGDSLLEAV